MAGRWWWSALLGVVVGCGGASQSGVRAVHGIVGVDPAQVDFGDVALGKEGTRTVLVRNDGLVEARVDALPGLTAAGFEPVGLPLVLGAGEVRSIEVKFKPPTLGNHGRMLQLVTDVPGDQPEVGLRGHAVRGLVQLSGDTLDFGNVVLGETAIADVVFNNNDGKAETTVRIGAPTGADAAAFSSTQLGPVDFGPQQVMPVHFEFKPFRLGTLSAVIPVTPCPTCVARNITVTGTGVTTLLDVQPPSIDFGDVHLGQRVAQAFSVRNTSNSPLTVTSIGFVSGQFLTAAFDARAPAFVLNPGEVATGKVSFQPLELGQQDAKAQIVASDGAPGVLAVKGLGMGPVLQAKPRSLYVGAAAVGTTRPAFITVTNVGVDPRGTSPLSLNGISLEATDPAWRLESPKAMLVGGPGSSVTVNFSFSPAAPGYSQAKLVLLSNDDLHPRTEIPLTAFGRDLAPCQIEVNPASPVDFGVGPLFHPTVQGFELINRTADDCIVGDPQLVAGGPAFRWPGNVVPAGRTLPPAGRMSVRIEFQPEAAQTYTGSVEFYLSNKAQQRLRVDLVGWGEDTCFYVSPGAVDFGAATQGCGMLDGVAYAVNHCGGPVKVESLTTSGAPFSLGAVPGVPFTVQSQTSVAIPVRYEPATVGDDVGTLIVKADVRATAYKVGLTAGTRATASVVDEWDQSTPKVDMLIVIDNSGSTAEEHRALANSLDTLWNRIALAKADFHIAVTTTGMTPYTAGWTQCPGGAQGGEGGRFFPVDNSHPRLLTPTTPNVRQALFDNTNVGECHWDERFLDPVVAALTQPLVTSTKAPGTPWPADGNAGFLRDDARLALLAVMDVDDMADTPNPPPVKFFTDQIIAAKKGARDLVSFAGIVPLRVCPTAEGVANRFYDIAKELNGHLFDVCDLNNFGSYLENALGDLLAPLTSFKLSQTPKDPRAIEVSVNGAVVTGWSYDATANRIVFASTAVPAPGSHVVARYDAACN